MLGEQDQEYIEAINSHPTETHETSPEKLSLTDKK
jgi:hypothetical protein